MEMHILLCIRKIKLLCLRTLEMDERMYRMKSMKSFINEAPGP